MAVVIEMPKLSDTMEEGGVASWLKNEGDTVEEGEALVEIETDKATMEFESPEEGVLLKIVVQAGGKCALNAPIAVVGEAGENPDEALAAFQSSNQSAPAEDKKEEKSATTSTPTPQAPTSAPSATPSSTGGRVKASPLAKKIAQEKGLSLAQVQGTGPQGRIIMRDVEGLQGGGTAAAVPVGAMQSRGDQTINVSMMRATIAKRLHAAKNDAPHFYLTRSVNMSQINQWRAELNKNLDENTPKVSINDLLILLTAKALRQHPEINSSWQGDVIKQFGDVHVAFAVALPSGLVTPVVKHADALGARDIALTTKSLAKQAREGQNLDYTSGTFTISNLGMLGIEEFTAIINPPQSAILAIGTTQLTPVVDETGGISVQPKMKMTMSCDHRVIDGAQGARFLQTLTSYLEQPLLSLS